MELEIKTAISTSKIIIQKGILNNLKNYLIVNGKIMIITDDGIPYKYIENIKKQFNNVAVHIIKQGEQSKSIANFIAIQKDLLKHNFTRNDILISLGGGVVGDLTGFVASTYKRGIKYVQIPTTTLSQIDSSIGGKTAIDLDEYKNVIGTFYQPFLVLIDINVLDTLPKRHFYNGLVEALKIGLTFDKDLVKLFEKDNFEENLENIITRAVYLKKIVVEQDEKEQNIRKVLNFGHTIGHGIESSNFGNLLHGECVAKGMLYFITSKEIKEIVKNILGKMQISSNYKVDIHKVMRFIKNDKKAFDDKISAIFVDEIGKYRIENISFERIENLIREE